MKVRWLPEVVDELEEIVEYLAARSPQGASRVANELHTGIESLADNPYKGRPHEEPGLRQLVFKEFRYVATYRVVEDTVEVLSITHTSRNAVVH